MKNVKKQSIFDKLKLDSKSVTRLVNPRGEKLLDNAESQKVKCEILGKPTIFFTTKTGLFGNTV